MAKCGSAVKDVKVKKAVGAGTKAKPSASKGKGENAVLEVLHKEHKFGQTTGLKNEGIAEKSGGNNTSGWFFKVIKNLTEAGAEFMGFKKADVSNVGSNDELHRCIKEQLNPRWKGAQIFDLLIKHGPQTRKQLARKAGINDRSHSFSYGLKEIKAMGFVENTEGRKFTCKLVSLSDRAWATKPSTTVKVDLM